MYRPRRILVAVLAAGLLSSCGQDAGSTGAASPRPLPSGTPTPSASASPLPVAPKTQLPVPSLYDTSRGWESNLPGDQFPLPHSGAVAVVQGGELTVLDVTNGQVLGKSTVTGPGSVSAFAITVQGKDYLVASSSGTVGGDVVRKGREVTTIDIFHARPTGNTVKPAHHLELDGDGSVTNGGGGLLVTFEDDIFMTVDPATGETKKYDLRRQRPPARECKICIGVNEVLAVTPRGPLLAMSPRPFEHYWIPGSWSAKDISDSRVFITWVKDHFIAKWYDDAAKRETWAVLDGATGKVRAEVTCVPDRRDDDSDGAAVSAGGRYLVYSQTAFDLEKGTGHCFEETDQDKPIHLNGVTDDGVAFGVAPPTDEVEDPRVIVDLATGQVEPADYRVRPFADYSGYGLFWDDSTKTMVAYPHRT